jgi:hypothetical protein
MNPTKNLIELKLYMNPTKNLIEPTLYMNPTTNLIDLVELDAGRTGAPINRSVLNEDW